MRHAYDNGDIRPFGYQNYNEEEVHEDLRNLFGNGVCDGYLNVPAFNFDSGDCCSANMYHPVILNCKMDINCYCHTIEDNLSSKYLEYVDRCSEYGGINTPNNIGYYPISDGFNGKLMA